MEKLIVSLLALFVAVLLLEAQSNTVIDSLLGSREAAFGDAVYLVLSAAKIVPEKATPNDAVWALQARDWGVAGRSAKDPIDLGEYAFLLMRAFDVHGGIMYRLFPAPATPAGSWRSSACWRGTRRQAAAWRRGGCADRQQVPRAEEGRAMTKARALSALAVLAVLVAAPLGGLDFDWGGFLYNDTELGVSQLGNSPVWSIAQKDRLAAWLDARFSPGCFSLSAQGSYTFTLDRPYLFDLDSLKADWSPVPILRIEAGRNGDVGFHGTRAQPHTSNGLRFSSRCALRKDRRHARATPGCSSSPFPRSS